MQAKQKFLAAFSASGQSLFIGVTEDKFNIESAHALELLFATSPYLRPDPHLRESLQDFIGAFREAVEKNLDILNIVARAISKSGDYHENRQNGLFGLVSALDSFKPECDCSFAAHATRCIRQAILKRRAEDRLIRVPSSTQFKYRKLENRLLSTFDGRKSRAEHMRDMHVSDGTGRLIDRIANVRNPASIEVRRSGQKPFCEMLIDCDPNLSNVLSERERPTIDQILGVLSERFEQHSAPYQALILKFGLDRTPAEERTLKEVAQILGYKDKQNADYYVKKALRELTKVFAAHTDDGIAPLTKN